MGVVHSDPKTCHTLLDSLKYLAEHHPDREVFIFYHLVNRHREPYTARDVYELGGRFAARLHDAGFGPGDIIANTLVNSPERMVTDVGILLAGCTGMNGQLLLADGEDFFLSARNARTCAVILNDSATSQAWRVIGPCLGDVTSSFITPLTSDRAPEMTKAVLVTRSTDHVKTPLLESLKTSTGPIYHCPGVTADDLAYVNVTSGSTGYSKAVARCHREMFDIAQQCKAIINSVYALQDETVLYSDRFFGWGGGFPFGQYAYAEKRVMQDFWDSTVADHETVAATSVHAIQAENCSVIFFMPLELGTVVNYIKNNKEEEAINFTGKLFLTGGQPLRKSQLRDYLDVIDHVALGYGSTETIFGAIHVYSKHQVGEIQDYMCGKPFGGFQIRVVDSDGKPLPAGETGEIHLKGGNTLKTYFNRLDPNVPERSTYYTDDGWFKIGDYGHLDSEGNLFVIGRCKDTIMHGVTIVYPSWLEERLLAHPDVQDACCVPVPDPVMYEKICACTKVKDGHTLSEADMREFSDNLFLTISDNTPRPEYFLMFSSDYPLTNTGKTDRQHLKRLAQKTFGSVE